jgi:hypothetical protein
MENLGSMPHKIHIPVENNGDSYFFLEGKKFSLLEGDAHEVNNSLKHSVVNNGETDRIHLIFEYLDFDIQTTVIKNQMNISGGLRDA